MSFKKWKEVELGELCEYSSERIVVEDLDLNNYVSTENMLPNRGRVVAASKLPTTKTVIKYDIGDTLISNIRPYFKKIWYASKIGGSSNDVLVFKNLKKRELDNEYLYYYLSKDEFFDYVMGSAKGTKMPRGDKNAIMKYSVNVPQLIEQKAIANILSTLDEKIEVNNQINKNLEEMAQAIFKHWFVDFEFPNEEGKPYKSNGGKMVESELGLIPKGWEVKKVIELNLFTSDYVANGSFKSLKDNVTLSEEKEYAVFIRNTDLKNKFSSGMKYVDKHSYEFLSKTKLYGDEVIISNVADVGSVYLCPDLEVPMTLGNNVIMLKSEINSRLNYFFYRLFKSDYGQYLLETITSGSAQMKFNKTDFRNLKIAFPNKDVLNEFLNIETSIENLEHKSNKENRKLSKVRDNLLPKLMSGEIRVPLKLDDE